MGLREGELSPDEVHSTETYEFAALSPEVVADYVLDQKGATYKDGNCQAYAAGLMNRIFFHGRDLKSKRPIIGTVEEYTWRFIALLSLAALIIAVSMAGQWFTL